MGKLTNRRHETYLLGQATALGTLLLFASPALAARDTEAYKYAKAALENCASAKQDFDPLLDGSASTAGFTPLTWSQRLAMLESMRKRYTEYRDQALAQEPALKNSDREVKGMVMGKAWAECDALFASYPGRLEQLAKEHAAQKDKAKEIKAQKRTAARVAAQEPKLIKIAFWNATPEQLCGVQLAPVGSQKWDEVSGTWSFVAGTRRWSRFAPGHYALRVKRCKKGAAAIHKADIDLSQSREVVILGQDSELPRPDSDYDTSLRLVLKTDIASPPKAKKGTPCQEDRKWCYSVCGSQDQQCGLDCLQNQGQSRICQDKCQRQSRQCRDTCAARFGKCK